MSNAQLVITAVVLEGRTQTDVARACGFSKSWVGKLGVRYRQHGDAAFTPRCPNTSPQRLPDDLIERITTLRHELTHQGLDTGPTIIAWHLATHHHTHVATDTSPSTPPATTNPPARQKDPNPKRNRPNHRFGLFPIS